MPPQQSTDFRAPEPGITPQTVIARSPSVVTSEVDGEVLMMSIEQGRYFALNEVASDVWQRLESPCSFADLIDGLAASYDAGPAVITADMIVLLRDMLARDVIVLRQP
jgi:hypothetical protein